MRWRVNPGMVIDGFELRENLGTGGMAQLWAVSREDDPAPLIMKIPMLIDSDDPLPIVCFETEQMIMPRLSGPHVPRFVATGPLDPMPYIVMERIPGASLKSRLDEAPLPWSEVAAIGAKVAHALHDLHRQHVIHLDIKPSNVMIRDTGEAVLIDYGFSRHEYLPDLLAEEFREPFGTTPYMAPEQVLQDRADPRSDLFALGVMMYVFVTGERPFGNPRGGEIRRRLWRDPVPPRALNPDCPRWLQEVILRCLEVDPDERYATAALLALDLENPEQVRLTERAERLERDGGVKTFRRWLKARKAQPLETPDIAGHLSRAPIILAAIDLSPGNEDLAEALRRMVGRILSIEGEARIACVNVLKTSRIAVDILEDQDGNSLHVQRLVQLRHWGVSLDIPQERITCSVLEAPDPAAALVDYARRNNVDHIVIGARASSALRRYLGSVSSQVVAEAPCSVTVVRTPKDRRAENGQDASA
ncbi:serine/threonine protein kinase [Microvirga lotononidis]|uniref:Serine/threonine protein kinase n=1 Tax=Microvirga lotononidis TaxID=864069 RepID=I4YZG4_9HYPH|nr:bifunctional serine/threonine-protein kinase/universal stress protein [Microvirga lotononidis]EIM29356.1 serine/threonine protein kinase [Microvirga lotononidis]WQO29181.1 bifunctional serine/threonine-protein kinase/universal stress protein [Microvirga lotononidis]